MVRAGGSIGGLLLALALAGAAALPAAGLPGVKKIKDSTKKAVEKAFEGEQEAPAQAEKAGAKPAAGDPAATGAAAAGKPGEGAWLNYDFVPGDRVLFYDDFSSDPVGNFPRRLEFRQGNMEIAEWNGRRLLRATSWDSEFAVPLPSTLPERFTLEFEMSGPSGRWVEVSADPVPDRANDFSHVLWGARALSVRGGNGGTVEVQFDRDLEERLFSCRAMGNGSYLKVYTEGTRDANIPNATFGHGNKLTFVLQAQDDWPIFIGPIRVAEGGRIQLYDQLAAQGRVATQGILFDTGSDGIRPESTPTLTDIGQMLAQHAELKLRIEGHTDNVGDAAANQSLSERRAAAVKTYLVSRHQIADARLETAGFGATRPVAPNETPEGRQTNRRVELVKL